MTNMQSPVEDERSDCEPDCEPAGQ